MYGKGHYNTICILNIVYTQYGYTTFSTQILKIDKTLNFDII